MSLQSRLSALITAIGADIKALDLRVDDLEVGAVVVPLPTGTDTSSYPNGTVFLFYTP